MGKGQKKAVQRKKKYKWNNTNKNILDFILDRRSTNSNKYVILIWQLATVKFDHVQCWQGYEEKDTSYTISGSISIKI